MFIKIDSFWLNTRQIVSMEPHGKAFRVNLSNGNFIALNQKNYILLIKTMKIKSPLKSMKKKILGKIASQPPPSVEAVKKNVVIKPKITAPPIPVKRNIPAKPKIENDK